MESVKLSAFALDEALWSKEIDRIKTKKSLYDFEHSDLKTGRNFDFSGTEY